MTAASARKAQQILRDRARSNRAAGRIRRTGHATLATHAIAAGLQPREARSVAGSLRNAANNLGITGNEVTMSIKWRSNSRQTAQVTARLFTQAEVARMASHYQPRKPAYRAVAAQLRLAA